jgi:hypothetical protein
MPVRPNLIEASPGSFSPVPDDDRRGTTMATTRPSGSADAPSLITGIGRQPLTAEQIELLSAIRTMNPRPPRRSAS